MRGSKHYLDGFTRLHELSSHDEQRATWRQSMATLAEATLESRGVPLEGANPDLLLESVRAALASDLVDDLGFLSPPAAACALYELASALPLGAERRELGRRVLVRLHEGDASTFIALATAVALGSTRAFEGAAMRARVGLALVLPIGAGASADALALSLISRRELAQRWLVEPSTGSLPARRMAARLLERAAREAARRAIQGDDGGVWLFDSHSVQTAWSHLMSDREPLVWRHIATGRGLLSAVVPRFAEEVEGDLSAALSLSRARRGATSLAARVAIRPREAVARAKDVLEGPLLARDPGVAAAMIYGLPRAAEVEPEAAEALLLAAVDRGGTLAAEALLELRREWSGTSFGQKAVSLVRTRLEERSGGAHDDEGHGTLLDILHEELGGRPGAVSSLPEAVLRALMAFASAGARTAYELARDALEIAEERVSQLSELHEHQGPEARQKIVRILHELDVGLLESSALTDLLSLGGHAGEAGTSKRAGAQQTDSASTGARLFELLSRLKSVLMASESQPYGGGEGVPHLTLRMRRLRALLHLLDIDTRDKSAEEQVSERRTARLETVRALFERVAGDAPSAMDRIVHATIARACDGLVRDEVFELSDVVLAAAAHVPTPEGFSALSEGSMLPEVKSCLKALSALVRTLHKVKPDAPGQRAIVEALSDLSHALPAESSPRTEGLRASLLRLSRALRHVTIVSSLRELALERRVIESLEASIDELVQLSAGARRRLGSGGVNAPPTSGHGVWALALSIERAAIDDDRSGLELTLEALGDSLRAELPPLFALVIARLLRPLLERPLERPLLGKTEGYAAGTVEDRPLPAWLPPARLLGGFYVLRALGSGAVGSVFVVKRSEERADPRAPLLALKVPEYDGSAARSLSEAEFLRMFRQEAGALLSVPPHVNLASFVTFDAGAKPKPVLVMELVEGLTLERVLEKGDMDNVRAVNLIRGVLCGLEAMHSVDVGHLDVKPSNVILRERHDGAIQPVLVDFGLAGRHVRPGCATGNYGAPEIWGLDPEGYRARPMPADVYALGCVAFEVFTGQVLFDEPTETAMIAAHIGHDGRPAKVSALAQAPHGEALAEWLSTCLRKDPRDRATVPSLLQGLPAIKRELQGCEWPLQIPGRSPY